MSIPFFSHFFPIFLPFKPFSPCMFTNGMEFPAFIKHATMMGQPVRLKCVRLVLAILTSSPRAASRNLGGEHVFSTKCLSAGRDNLGRNFKT